MKTSTLRDNIQSIKKVHQQEEVPDKEAFGFIAINILLAIITLLILWL